MELKDMALEPQKDAQGVACSPDYYGSKYGYGLQLQLDDEQCKKLGLDRSLPAGTIVKIEAKALVESTGERVARKEEDGLSVHMSLQITDLGVEPQGTEPHPSELLYTHSSS